MAKGISIHIGLNAVDPVHYQGWDGKLTACENDARAMQEIAIKQGFQSTLLLTKQATAEAIITAISDAATKLDKGDMLFVTASLHGGQIMDDDHDEEDNIDETWCAYDREVRDDELGILWKGFRAGVRIFVLSDSCHSGTILKVLPDRDGGTMKIRTPINTKETGVEIASAEEVAVRALPIDVALKTYHRNKPFYDEIKKRTAAKSGGSIVAHVKLISGCQDNQTSLDGDINGAFTTALLLTWNDGKFTGDYQKFHARIMKLLPSTQSPNLYNIGVSSATFDKEKPFSI
jgi:metacaspase-1